MIFNLSTFILLAFSSIILNTGTYALQCDSDCVKEFYSSLEDVFEDTQAQKNFYNLLYGITKALKVTPEGREYLKSYGVVPNSPKATHKLLALKSKVNICGNGQGCSCGKKIRVCETVSCPPVPGFGKCAGDPDCGKACKPSVASNVTMKSDIELAGIIAKGIEVAGGKLSGSGFFEFRKFLRTLSKEDLLGFVARFGIDISERLESGPGDKEDDDLPLSDKEYDDLMGGIASQLIADVRFALTALNCPCDPSECAGELQPKRCEIACPNNSKCPVRVCLCLGIPSMPKHKSRASLYMP